MATVAELAALEVQEVGWVLFIEGWSKAFTNRSELAGTGVSSWIGTASRTVLLGLEVPSTIKLAIGLVESGMPCDDGATFSITDRNDAMIDFAEDETGTVVFQRLAAVTTTAPATLLDTNGVATDLRGYWINGESIGSAGARRQFQVLPNDPMPGYDHAAVDADIQEIRASTIRTSARFLEGLPCALYLIRKDRAAGTWASWSTQYDSTYALQWWGTIRRMTAVSHEWKIECEGPSSWLRKPLNVNRSSDWKVCFPVAELSSTPGQREDLFAVKFHYVDYQDSSRQACAVSAYDTTNDDITSGQSPDLMADEINTRLQTLAGTAGVDETFSTYLGGEFTISTEGVKIRVEDNNTPCYGGVVELRMHAKVWLHLGWDLVLQKKTTNEITTPIEVDSRTDGEAQFYRWASNATVPDPVSYPDPGPGYWSAMFTTVPIGRKWDSFLCDSDGAPRFFLPLYQPGVSLLRQDAQMTLDIGIGEANIGYLEGQTARPPAGKTLDTGACDTTAWFAFRGQYRESIDAEPEMRWQLGKVSWVDDGTSVAIDSNSQAIVWLEKWLDPKPYGCPNDKIGDQPWAALNLEFVPVALFHTSSHDTAMQAHNVLARIMLSTGTASWTGYEEDDSGSLTLGSNNHTDATGSGGGDDNEIADLGLGIPQSMIDLTSFETAAAALPEGKGGVLNKCRLMLIGPADSQDVIGWLIKPRGWCFSLRNGKYGLFSRGAPLDVADADATITAADIAGEPGAMPPWETVDFRPLEPIDLIEVRHGGNLFAGNSDEKTMTMKARDPRAVQRKGNASVTIDARTLPDDETWSLEFGTLWTEQMARWFAEPHAMVTVTVKGDVARDIWPGSIVRYTSEWPATREGAYGMTSRLGRVVSVSRDTQTLAATCEILMAPGDPTEVRRFAPIARLVDNHTTIEGRHDATTGLITCYADAWGRGGSVKDVAAFAEPDWSTTGGYLDAQAWSSWDGLTWEATASLRILSVDTAASTMTYDTDYFDVYDGFGIWEKRYTVIVPNVAGFSPDLWPAAVFGVLCGTDGLFGAGNADGYPWVE